MRLDSKLDVSEPVWHSN